MLESTPIPSPSEPEARHAIRPPPADPLDVDPMRMQSSALSELGQLIAELERWRRRQLHCRPPVDAHWVFLRDASGSCVRIRFEDGRPAQLRTSASDRVQALAAACAALDVELSIHGPWKRDANTLEWVATVRV